jgi:hypothetical protein
MKSFYTTSIKEIRHLANQLDMGIDLVFQEIKWALGEERINRVTPTYEQFQEWFRQRDGLLQFWHFANMKLGSELTQEEAHDLWECIDLTLNAQKRRAFSFQDYLMVAIRSEQKCVICSRRPPEISLEIDHILPASKGGSNSPFNLRFLCQYHNRSRGNRFRWADVWRNSI